MLVCLLSAPPDLGAPIREPAPAPQRSELALPGAPATGLGHRVQRRALHTSCCRNQPHWLSAQFIREFFLNEHRRGERAPRDFEEIDQTVFVQVNMFVSFDRDPVALDGEEHGDIAARGKCQVNVEAVYCGQQTRQDFDDRLPPFERLRKNGAQEYDAVGKVLCELCGFLAAHGLEVSFDVMGVHFIISHWLHCSSPKSTIGNSWKLTNKDPVH